MPTYDYQTENAKRCKQENCPYPMKAKGLFEVEQSVHDKKIRKCDVCEQSFKRLVGSIGFTLKGGGWTSK